MMRRRALAAFSLACSLAACGPGPAPAPAPAAGQSSAAASASEASPLTALPECSSPPADTGKTVKGLTAPEGTVVLTAEPQKPLVNITGYAPMTPAKFEAAFTTMKGVTILLSENEIFEAELLVTNGTHRTFFKATATCSEGSQLLAVVAPELDAQGLPVPQRATATPTPVP